MVQTVWLLPNPWHCFKSRLISTENGLDIQRHCVFSVAPVALLLHLERWVAPASSPENALCNRQPLKNRIQQSTVVFGCTSIDPQLDITVKASRL